MRIREDVGIAVETAQGLEASFAGPRCHLCSRPSLLIQMICPESISPDDVLEELKRTEEVQSIDER